MRKVILYAIFTVSYISLCVGICPLREPNARIILSSWVMMLSGYTAVFSYSIVF